MSDEIKHLKETTRPGDIIQITDVLHPWFPALLIVDEIKNWGVQAYVIIPKSNDGEEATAQAFNRLDWDMFVKVGQAAVHGD